MTKYLSILILFISTACFAEHPDSWKNFFAVSSDDMPTATARYAKQMGYEYTAFKSTGSTIDYSDAVFNDLHFYVTNPHEWFKPPNPSWWTLGVIKPDDTWDAEQQQWFRDNMILRSGTETALKDQLAYGDAITATGSKPKWCFQTAAVREYLLASVITLINARLDDNPSISFAGVLYDEPRICGVFGTWTGSSAYTHYLSAFTPNGTNSCVGTHTHDYADYKDGNAEMLISLKNTLKEEYGSQVKFMAEPTQFYRATNPNNYSEYIYTASQHARSTELIMDLYCQEAVGLNWLQDTNIYTSGMCDSYSMTGNTQHSNHTYDANKEIAVACGTSAAWYNWFLSYTASGGTPDFKYITEVYPRLKLIRCVPNWCNLSDLPDGTESTSYDGSTFLATHTARAGNAPFAKIGTDVMQCYMWGSDQGRPFGQFRDHELFAVVRGTDSTRTEMIQIDPNRNVYDIQRVNEYFEPDGNDAKADFIRHTSGNYELVDDIITGTNTDGGVGYRFKVSNNPVQVKGSGRTTFQ